jgi:hypothetical protein
VLLVAIWVTSRRNAGQESILVFRRVLANGCSPIQLGTVRSSRVQVIKQGPMGGTMLLPQGRAVELACIVEAGAVRGPVVAVALDALDVDEAKYH